MLKLFMAMVTITTVETILLLFMADNMGWIPTGLLIITTGALGSWLAKREGLGVLKSLEKETKAGFPSGDRIIEGLMILIGAVTLLTPGVLTDLFGFALIVPWTRQFMAPHIKRYLLGKFGVTGVTGDAARVVQPDTPIHHASDAEAQAKAAALFEHPEG